MILLLLYLCFIVNQATTLVIPLAIGRVLDRVIPQGDASGLQQMVALLFAVLIVKLVLIFCERELAILSGSLIVRDVRLRLHGHFLRLSLRVLDEYQVGRIVARVMGDAECIRNLLLTGIMNSSASLARFVFVLATLLYLDWQLALVSCAVLPIFLLGFWRFANKAKPAYHQLNEDNAQLFSAVNETFSGVRVVKTYCAERRANRAFLAKLHKLLRQSLGISRTQHIITVVWEGSAWLSAIMLLWFGGLRVMAGAMTIGELVAFYALLGQMQGPIADLVGLNATLQPALSSIEQVGRVFETQPEIQDAPHARQAGVLRGEIEFKGVAFSYKSASEEGSPPRRRTLEGISFRVEAGQCVALVGASGSGKSTILNLLARFYDVDGGAISVDGIDVREYGLRSYLKNFAIVLQDTFLFRGTIRDNIRFARWHASEDEIIRAAVLSGAWPFIQELEGGLDAHCTERGVSLSGGQRQRLALARAILAEPRILILDEATSALDSQTEALVQAAMDQLMHGRTTFVVAHRLSSIMHADQIVVLHEGRIAEMGQHQDLLQRGGRYAAMVEQQYGKARDRVARAAAGSSARRPQPSREETEQGSSSSRRARPAHDLRDPTWHSTA